MNSTTTVTTELAKGDAVTVKIIGIAPVVAEYVGVVKVSTKYPKGGHRVRIQGGNVVVKNTPTRYASTEAAVAASYGR